MLLKHLGASSEIEEIGKYAVGERIYRCAGKGDRPCDVSRIAWFAALSTEKLWKQWYPGSHGPAQQA